MYAKRGGFPVEIFTAHGSALIHVLLCPAEEPLAATASLPSGSDIPSLYSVNTHCLPHLLPIGRSRKRGNGSEAPTRASGTWQALNTGFEWRKGDFLRAVARELYPAAPRASTRRWGEQPGPIEQASSSIDSSDADLLLKMNCPTECLALAHQTPLQSRWA